MENILLIQPCLDSPFNSFEVDTSSLDREPETPTDKGYNSDDSVPNATEFSSDLKTLKTPFLRLHDPRRESG